MKGFKNKQKKGKGAQHSSNSAPQAEVSKSFAPSHKGIKKVLIACVVIVVVGVAGWQLYDFVSNKTANNKAASECSRTLITAQTSADLKTPLPATLKPIVDKIIEQSDYTQDASCMYVVTAYYISMGDPKNARSSYDQLVKVYNAKTGYSSEISYVALKPDQVKPIVELLEQQARDVEKNSKIIKPAQ